MGELNQHRDGATHASASNWEQVPTGATYECHFFLEQEETGFSVHCLNLPGIVSQGDDEHEAIENIKDAFRQTLLCYRDSREPIPWARDFQPPANTNCKRVAV